MHRRLDSTARDATIMNAKNLFQLLILAALWGASFLFIRVGVTDFGVAPLMALRVGIGAAFLIVVLLARRPLQQSATILRTRAFPLLVVGILNSAAPFCLFAYAELTLSAGVTSVINATTPLWGGLVAFVWLRDRLTGLRTLGLAIGFLGVLMLVWDQIATPSGSAATPLTTALAAGAALGATLLYGIAANYTKRYL
ncbi:MAG: DMT family transporter, partial [Paraburkholderia graminis]